MFDYFCGVVCFLRWCAAIFDASGNRLWDAIRRNVSLFRMCAKYEY